MPEGEVTPIGDPIQTPVTRETVDENGNTVIIGYEPGHNSAVTGPVSTAPVGLGIGSESEGA